jgi:hypothetical protein
MFSRLTGKEKTMPRKVDAEAKAKTVEGFKKDWQAKIAAKEAKVGEALAALAAQVGKSVVTVRTYVASEGLLGKRGRRKRGRKAAKAPQIAANPGKVLARLSEVAAEIEKLNQQLAALHQERKGLANSPVVKQLVALAKG